ncbi:MAG TPA: hypothetical protein PLQ22_04170 [Bacilli bacterium]|nr:hypothetical protein [Bacilli bacterium]
MVKIRNKTLSVEIALKGAELKKLASSISYIHDSNPLYWNKSAPFLFPIIGKLRDGKTIIDGKEYEIEKHGFLKGMVFDIVSQEEDEVVLRSKYSEETLLSYPFKYEVDIKFKLKGMSLLVDIKIKNVDDKKMAFNFGWHPAFKISKIEDYRLVFEKEEDIKSPKVHSNSTLDFNTIVYANKTKELKLKRELFNIDTILIKDVKSSYVYLLNKENKGIKLSFPDFKTLAIWTPFDKDAPFICLEPWYGNNDHFDTNYDFYTKDDLIILKPGKCKKFKYQIDLIE